MPTLNFSYETPGERRDYERAIAFVVKMRHLGQSRLRRTQVLMSSTSLTELFPPSPKSLLDSQHFVSQTRLFPDFSADPLTIRGCVA